MTYEEVYKMDKDEAFDKFLELRWNNPVVTITEATKYPHDNFLNLRTYPVVTVRLDGSMCEFSCDEPLSFCELPETFLKTILMNCK